MKYLKYMLPIFLVAGLARAQETVDWCNTQWPYQDTVIQGHWSVWIYGQVYEYGVTDDDGEHADSIIAQVGIGPDGSDPTVDTTGWKWFTAVFNIPHAGPYGNNYEYMGRIIVDSTIPPGNYDYCFRYSLCVNGVWGPWTYGDLNTGSATGYDPDSAGELVVLPGYPFHSITEIQDTIGTGSPSSPYEGDTVTTTGIVTGVYSNGFFLQEKPEGPWTGIWIYTGTAPTVSRGDSIIITGLVSEWYGMTELSSIVALTVCLSGCELPRPLELATGDMAQEQYEAVLVTIRGFCTNPDLGYGEWELNDGSGGATIDDKGYAFSPTHCAEYEVTGPVNYSYGNFKIEPRDSEDVVLLTEYVTIPKIQDTTGGFGADTSSLYDSTIVTTGVVTGAYYNGFFLQEKPESTWNGVWVYLGSTPPVVRGDSIIIKATVSEYNGNTELVTPEAILIVATDVELPNPLDLTTGEASDEMYEGVLVHVRGVCTDPDLGYGEWQIDDGTGALRIDDLGVGFTPDSGVTYDVTGPLYYSYGNFKIEPRDYKDIYGIIFADNFDTDTTLWTGDWAKTNEDAHSPDSSFTDSPNANYPDNANLIGQLIEPLDLTSYKDAKLVFWTKYFIEDGWDFGYVEASPDSGNTWYTLKSYTGYQDEWTEEVVDLSAFAGLPNVFIRFRLESDAAVDTTGWFVDDIEVRGYVVDISPPFIVHERPGYPPEGTESAVDNVILCAHVFDASTVISDTLYYSVDGSDYIGIPHDSVVTDNGYMYYYTIPAQPAGTHVKYYFAAKDTLGQRSVSKEYSYYTGELVRYDDENPGYYWVIYPEDTFAVMFSNTGDTTYTHVATVMFYFYLEPGADSFYVHVWDENGNDVIDPIPAYPDTTGGVVSWTAVDLRPYGIYIYPGTSLYIGLTSASDSLPAIFIDYPASFNHTYDLSNGTWELQPYDFFFRILTEVTTGADENITTLPKVFMLAPNYPNPCNGRTVIKYALPKDTHVTIEIYDISGRKVKTLVNEFQTAGWKTAVWDGTNESGEKVKSGIYFYRMKAGDFLKTRKMVVVK